MISFACWFNLYANEWAPKNVNSIDSKFHLIIPKTINRQWVRDFHIFCRGKYDPVQKQKQKISWRNNMCNLFLLLLAKVRKKFLFKNQLFRFYWPIFSIDSSHAPESHSLSCDAMVSGVGSVEWEVGGTALFTSRALLKKENFPTNTRKS